MERYVGSSLNELPSNIHMGIVCQTIENKLGWARRKWHAAPYGDKKVHQSGITSDKEVLVTRTHFITCHIWHTVHIFPSHMTQDLHKCFKIVPEKAHTKHTGKRFPGLYA